MSGTINPLKYSSKRKQKMKSIPGTSYWIEGEEDKRKEKVAEYKEGMYKQAAMKKDIEYNRYQRRVLDNPSESMIVSHPVGSGKTLTSIAKFEKLKAEGKASKALVVTPAGLRSNFGDDGVKKFTNSKYNIVGNRQEIAKGIYKDINPKADYNILSYEMYRKNPDKYIRATGADTLIVDEVHRTRNNATSTFKEMRTYRPAFKNFIGLTGSLVNNGVTDVQPLVDLASGGNHRLGNTKLEFNRNFLQRNNSGPYARLNEFRRPVIGFKNRKVMLDDISKFVDYADMNDFREIAKIPKKETELKQIPISKEQLKIYRAILKDNPNVKKLIYKKRLETMKGDEIASAYNKLIETRKLMNSIGSVMPDMDLKTSARVTPKANAILSDMDRHLKTTPDGQALLLTNLIRGGSDVLEAGLNERHIPYGKFIGKGNKGTTEEIRQKDVQEFKKGKKKALIISGAGAEGLSLGDTTWEGLFDPHYNPERMNQMEARGIRAHGLSNRPEELRKVHVNRYVSTVPKAFGIFKQRPYKTPDEVIYEIAGNKDRQNQMLFKAIKENQRQIDRKRWRHGQSSNL